jgi:hypothetical protein
MKKMKKNGIGLQRNALFESQALLTHFEGEARVPHERLLQRLWSFVEYLSGFVLTATANEQWVAMDAGLLTPTVLPFPLSD